MITKKRIWGMPPMLVAVCDECEAQLPPGIYFADIRENMRKAGWVSRKRNDGWVHLCQACAQAEKEQNAR